MAQFEVVKETIEDPTAVCVTNKFFFKKKKEKR